eukprot:3314986-Karenia_brevis.AAC.1
MAAADAHYQEMETLAPWRDPRVLVGKSAPKERPRRKKGKKGRGKGKKGKAKKEEQSLSVDEFADINPLLVDQGCLKKNLKLKKAEEKKKNNVKFADLNA